jgi:hypothetical protein
MGQNVLKPKGRNAELRMQNAECRMQNERGLIFDIYRNLKLSFPLGTLPLD